MSLSCYLLLLMLFDKMEWIFGIVILPCRSSVATSRLSERREISCPSYEESSDTIKSAAFERGGSNRQRSSVVAQRSERMPLSPLLEQ